MFDFRKPPKVAPGSSTHHLTGGLHMTLRHGGSWSKKPVTVRDASPLVFHGKPVKDPDPMVGFFLGAMSLQESMKFDTSYQGCALVTVVYRPTMPMPLQERGYYLECEVSQFYARKEDLVNLSDATSTVGQIPVEAPTDLDLKFMNMLATEYYALTAREPGADFKVLVRNLRSGRGTGV